MDMNYTNPGNDPDDSSEKWPYLNTSRLDDDAWYVWRPCENSGTHTLVLYSGYSPFTGLGDLQEDTAYYDYAYDDLLGGSAWSTGAELDLYTVDPTDGSDLLIGQLTMGDDDNAIANGLEISQYMCPERTYKIRAESGAADDDDRSQISWVFRNTCCKT